MGKERRSSSALTIKKCRTVTTKPEDKTAYYYRNHGRMGEECKTSN